MGGLYRAHGVVLGMTLGAAGLAIWAQEARATPSTSRTAHPTTAPIDPRAASCGRCHAEQYADWQDSMHRRSATDRFYVAAQRLDREPFCDACHAPRGGQPVAAVRLEDGVDCASCHLRAGAILASRVTPAGLRAHPMRASAELASSRFCAGCHEFRPPPPRRGASLEEGTFMQRTFSEHQSSPAALRGETCQSCHMPGGDHRTLGLRDQAFVQGGIEVAATARRASGYGTVVDVTLTARDVGHAFPTGDMLRALEVRAIDPTAARGAVERTETLGRVFRLAPPPRPPALAEVEDQRLLPDVPRTVSLRLPTRPSSVTVEVNLLRTALHHARRQGLSASDVRVPLRAIEIEVRP